TTEIEYEGFPLLLRRPDYNNIWEHIKKYTHLASVQHLLDKTTSNGLPEKDYNKSLAEFDHYMCSLFDRNFHGLIFLVETFGGKRNYYYYITSEFAIEKLVEQVIDDFDVKLTVTNRSDVDWDFLKAYPVKLFPQ